MGQMESITLHPGRGSRISGRVYVPPLDAKDKSKGRPLIVAIHGGTYSSAYFELNEATSITKVSHALKVPVVAIDRPTYMESFIENESDFGDTFLEQQGRYIHELLLPEIWKTYGGTWTKTTSIVLHAHSVGAAVATVVAGCHGRDAHPKYPLSGLVTSGLAAKFHPEFDKLRLPTRNPDARNQTVSWPADMKNKLMVNADEGLCSEEVLMDHASANHAVTLAELEDIQDVEHQGWLSYWEGYASDVRVAHMITHAANDRLWDVNEKNMAEFAKAYSSCPRMETSILPLAPHDIEISFHGQAWLTRCFGFAMECAVTYEMGKERAGV